MFHRYGYRAGLRQVTLEVSLAFDLPPRLNLSRLDQWLEHAFDAHTPSLASVWAAAGKAPAQHVACAQLLLRVLALYQMLCRASNLPCLEPGRIDRLQAQGSRWQARLWLPALQNLPPTAFQNLARHALRLARTLLQTPITTDNQQALYQAINEKIVDPAKALLPGGHAIHLIIEQAFRAGIPFEYLGTGLLQLGWGNKAQVTLRSASHADSAVGARICSDKLHTANLLRQAGFPVPEHELIQSTEGALAAAERLGWPVVVKPANRERGEGVTINLRDSRALLAAITAAQAFSPRVLVEQQVSGTCHRLLIVGHHLLYASRRDPKSVTGDGQHTVRQLVDHANAAEQALPPWRRKKAFPLDALALDCLAKAGLAPGDTPATGQMVPLRPFTSAEWGGSAEDISDHVHPDNIALARSAAQVLGLTVAGIDLITHDIHRPWHETGAMINEVNFTPYLGGALPEARALAYVHTLLPDGGRLPIHAVLGSGDLWPHARALQQQLLAQGQAAHLCSTQTVETPAGQALPLACHGLFQRSIALLRRREVQALIVVLDSPEWLETGLPLDRIDALHLVGDVSTPPLQTLLALLTPHCHTIFGGAATSH